MSDSGTLDAVRLALTIAKSETRGRHYRDDVVGDVLLAVAEGERTREGMERACRRSIRREWRRTSRLVEAGADQSSGNPQFADLWEAMRTLSPRQYEAIHLVFWIGNTQTETATEMGISERAAGRLIERAVESMKIFLGDVQKKAICGPLVVGDKR